MPAFEFGKQVAAAPSSPGAAIHLCCDEASQPREMIAALFYLQWQSFRNRLVTRFKRLKQPKYLIGAIVGGLWLYFYFFRFLFGGYSRGPQGAAGFTLSPEHRLLYELGGALALFVIVLLAWIIPHERAALTFTEAEVAFLFPAPITRRNLIHYKLLRSQLRILFAAFLLTLFSRRFGGNPLTHAFGWWLILSTLNLHFLGASFMRTLLTDRGVSNWLRRLVVLGLVAAMIVGVWFWAKRTLPPFSSADMANFDSILDYAQRLLTAGPALYLLYPFRLVVRPFLAPDIMAFFIALMPALLIFALHYLWVIYSDVAFEEASVEASQKLATRIAAARAGNWQAAQKTQKAKRAWFRLPPTGPPPTALLWKNLIGVGQVFSPRLWIVLMAVVIGLAVGMGNIGHGKNFAAVASFLVAIALAYSLLLGPQLLRLDFRHDLPRADVLKTFPLRGWQVALGEILAPVVVLIIFQWLLLLVGTGLLIYVPGKQTALFLAVVAGAAIVLPVLDFLLLLIPNAAVLLFPSWIRTGKDSPRGIEATGQRLIFALGQLLVFTLALLPAAIVFAGVFLLLNFALGPAATVPLASLGATVVLVVEAGFGVMLLGKLFERFDVTEETAD
ncbi:MAG TPA: putative ABC exporter domain-containing protein [Verrucomicrobiae bacterium]|nr:putative ABC exporter domain-containing protein [Verrucomicrobiae bacterium]